MANHDAVRISPRPSRGVTLVELVVALFLIGVTVTAGLSLFAWSQLEIIRTNTRERAVQLARNEVERMRAATYANVETFGPRDFVVGPEAFSAQVIVTEVALDPPNADPRCKELVVTVANQALPDPVVVTAMIAP